jgi:osmotically-inducible protein OsmY
MKRTVALLSALGTLAGCSRREPPITSTTQTTSATQEVAPTDDQVAAEITRRLGAEPKLSMAAKGVKVSVDHGVATLRGDVSSPLEKDAIHAIANGAPGVVGLSDELALARVPSSADSDRVIEQNARRALRADGTLQNVVRDVDVTSTNGVVTVRGSVASDEERRTIERIVEGTPGVAAVTNDVGVHGKAH